MHGRLARLVDTFHELQDVVSVGVDDCNANFVVIFVLEDHMVSGPSVDEGRN